MYNEIKELYEYCRGLKIPCKLKPLYDGYKLEFLYGGDFIQHRYSYCPNSCVEPAIGCDFDYTACTLSVAKKLVEEYYGQKEN